MQSGSVAPDFSARTKDGTIGTLNSFKGRWVYLNFFSTKNAESLKEMPKIDALRKKFGDKIVFVSVNLDDSLKTYLTYVKSNPKFNWAIWYNYDKSFYKTAKDNYFVFGTEAYFLINNFGYLAQSPALSPSKGIEYKLNSLFKSAKRTTKTGIR
jgi:thiol-disulfide isomerase/thioredoxin